MAVATEKHIVHALPPVRPERCGKCPFNGASLDRHEREQAATVRKRIAGNPAMLWGCHEDTHAGAPKICAGFASAHGDRLHPVADA